MGLSSVTMMTILVDTVQSVLSRSCISERNEGFDLGSRYIRRTVMNNGGLNLKAKHTMDVRSGISKDESSSSAQ